MNMSVEFSKASANNQIDKFLLLIEHLYKQNNNVCATTSVFSPSLSFFLFGEQTSKHDDLIRSLERYAKYILANEEKEFSDQDVYRFLKDAVCTNKPEVVVRLWPIIDVFWKNGLITEEKLPWLTTKIQEGSMFQENKVISDALLDTSHASVRKKKM